MATSKARARARKKTTKPTRRAKASTKGHASSSRSSARTPGGPISASPPSPRGRREARSARRDLVVIGASGGGLEAVTAILGALPPTFPGAIAIVLHRSDRGPNVLVNILTRVSALPVVEAADGTPIESGRVFVPPLDRHLLIEGEVFRLSRGPKENHVRPAVDPLFRTAARSYGARVIGVILTGSLDDGTAGLLDVKRRGGLAIVQDPDEALFQGMPRSAVRNVSVDYQVPLVEVPGLLTGLAGVPVTFRPEKEAGPKRRATSEREGPFLSPDGGPVTAITCPECGGALREIQDGEVLRFVCHTGHSYGDQQPGGRQERRSGGGPVERPARPEREGRAHPAAGRAGPGPGGHGGVPPIH